MYAYEENTKRILRILYYSTRIKLNDKDVKIDFSIGQNFKF